jgi:hypothetical protein
MIKLYGYETHVQTSTFDCYNDVDCWLYSDLHDKIKHLKHGYGKALDHATRDIRLGHVSRPEAFKLVASYRDRQPVNRGLFLKFMGITDNAFDYIIDQHRNPEYWERDDSWAWRRLPSKGEADITQIEKADRSRQKFYSFLKTPRGNSSDIDDGFVLIGRGFNNAN